MRLPLVRRIAATALLLAWSAAVVRASATPEAPSGQQPGPGAKVLVARKSTLPGIGAPMRRESPPVDAVGAPAPVPAPGGRVDLTQPTYLRFFSSGMPHGHRDPPA